MAKKRAKSGAPAPLVVLDSGNSIEIRLGPEPREERETVRRLAHRVVDLLADSGRYDCLAESVECNLSFLADDAVVSNLTDLVREARASGKEVARVR